MSFSASPIGSRRLAAIMFTDIVGYTAITQSNESQALELVERHNLLLRPFFQKFNGKEIKTIGDSFLVKFESALDAVKCAIEIQEFLHDYNLSSHDQWKIKLRIGIHVGDVVYKGEDVLGDAVNIASRIQAFADAEGVCITQQAFDQVHNKISNSFAQLEKTELKNVKFPTPIYSVVMPWQGGESKSVELDKKRIAILPFANISPDSNDEYFAEGMTEEIISTVSQISELSVISRTSVMQYKKNIDKGVAAIGKELSVGTIMEGSVRKAGSKVRISVQLIDVSSDEHIWASTYDRQLDDIFAIQSDIARRVVDQLQIKLIDREKERITKPSTEDIGAYDQYLKGIHSMYFRTERSLNDAIRYFERAITKDPKFARAYAGLADCYLVLKDHGYLPSEIALPKAFEYSTRAIELDSNLAEARTAHANALMEDHRAMEAEPEFKVAISLNPNYSLAHHWYGNALADLGRIEEAVEEMKKAHETDPLSPMINTMLGAYYLYAGKYEEAWKQLEDTLKTEPGFGALYFYRAIYLSKFSKWDEAIREMKKGIAFSTTNPHYKGLLGYLYASKGEAVEANRILSELLDSKARNHYVPAESIALIYAGLNAQDNFFEFMSKAVKEKTIAPMQLLFSPIFDRPRKDPRFSNLL